jgi:hypothetical protein
MKEKTVRERLAQLEKDWIPTEPLVALLMKPDPNFAEIMLVVWGELEYYIDRMVAKTRQMDYAKARVTFLDRLSFEGKIDSLKEAAILTPKVYDSIRKFYKRRNELFHSERGKEHLYFTLTKSEKKERIEDARAVFFAVLLSGIHSKLPPAAELKARLASFEEAFVRAKVEQTRLLKGSV